MIIKFVKSKIHKLFNVFGVDIIKMGRFDQGFSSHVVKILKSRHIDCVLDVGANIGQYGTMLREIGFTGYIVSFEPVKSVYAQLLKKAENDPKWICYNLALSDESGSKDINVFSDSQFSSFLKASEYSKNTWQVLNSAHSEQVDLVRLDNLFAEIKIKTQCQHFYLKLDTQGFDLNVFRGAQNILHELSAVQTELSMIHVYENMADPYASLNEYHAQGFLISGLYPINHDESLAVIEYDCVLIKRI